MKRKMSEMSESEENRGVPAEVAPDTKDEVEADNHASEDDAYEEECVICLEQLSSEEWGRVTPCNHPFHKKCWWEWENAHNQRVDQQRQRGEQPQNEGPKCCLCNGVCKRFVDGTGEPASNPSPYVASEDPGDGGGGLFSRFLREASEEASGFMEFLNNEMREQFDPRRSNGGGRGSSASPNIRRSAPFVPPIFGSRSSSGRVPSNGSSPNRNGSMPPFGLPGMPPFFRNRSSPQQTWSSPSTRSNPYNLMRPGTQVVTQHLVSSPHLNGRRGSILRYQPQTRRYLVQLEADISSIITGDSTRPAAIKPENLLQTAKVKIHGLRSQPNLNGKSGTIGAYSRERARYVVRVEALLSPSREISLQPTNIRIPNGTCVRLEGLQRTPQWNGKYGTIVGWVEGQDIGSPGRYEVCLSRQYAVRVKMENVRL
ncbi:hypothetical protein ACHAWF_015463 [Thalassiosira exigua]